MLLSSLESKDCSKLSLNFTSLFGAVESESPEGLCSFDVSGSSDWVKTENKHTDNNKAGIGNTFLTLACGVLEIDHNDSPQKGINRCSTTTKGL